MGLYQAAAARLPGALRSADRGTEWALDRLLERDGWAALASQGRVTTGATALLAAGLTIRREATGDTRYDGVLRRLGRFLLAQTEPSGAVLASYDLAREAPVAGEYSKYYTGEAYWALARLHRAFPGEGWGEAADRIGAYLAKSRDEVEDHWPPIPDHWAAYGAAETVEFPERGRRPLTEDEVDYARGQAELFGVEARWVAQRFGPWGEVGAGQRHAPRRRLRRDERGPHRLVAGRPGGAPAGRPAGAGRRTRHLHRRTGAGSAIRRRGRRGRRPAGAGGGRVVPRRRDPHGRPAARARRAAANHPDRRGGRPGWLVRARR